MPDKWRDNAELRRAQIEGGVDITFSRVFVPHYEHLLRTLAPARVLEVGAGTGHLASRLAPLTEQYEAIEPSAGMHAVASDVLRNSNVSLHNVSIEDRKREGPFDLVIAHLVLQTIADLSPVLAGVCGAMALTSTFVFSLPHPCFYNAYKKLIPESNYHYMHEQSLEVDFGITLDAGNLIRGIPYVHRPLSRYFSLLRDADFTVTQFAEIFPEDATMRLYGNTWETPRYVVLHAQIETVRSNANEPTALRG